MQRKTTRNSFDNVSALLDATNLELLKALIDDPRIAMSSLARHVGMSAPAVTERVQRLQDAGVIRGARLDVDQAALGLGITAFVRVRPMPGQLQNIAELARETPEIVECHRITGEDCFILKMHLESLDVLDGALDEFLAYGQTTTSIIQSSPVPPRALPLPGGL